MKITKRVVNAISPLMKTHNFSLHQNCFYKVRNDIAFCVEIEAPAGNLYVAYYFMPLYIPSQYRKYTYGIRTRSISTSKSCLISQESDIETISRWCEEFSLYFREYILPFFMKMESPESLISNLKNLQSFVPPCPKVYITQLEAFTNLFLGKNNMAIIKISQFKTELQQAAFLTGSVKSQLSESMDEAARYLMDCSSDKRKSFFQDVIDSTFEKCFCKNQKTR